MRQPRRPGPLHHALGGDRLRLAAVQGLKQVEFRALRGDKLLREVQFHDFTVFRNPDLVDQAKLGGVVRILDGDAHQAVTESEHESLEHPAVVVVDVDHLTPSCLLPPHSGSAARTSAVLVARPSRLALTPWLIRVLLRPSSMFRELFRSPPRKHPSAACGASRVRCPFEGDLMNSFSHAVPVLALKTMRQHLEGSADLWIVRTGATLFSIFGGVALLLAMIGLYGIRSYTVARRTREIGIRMALGASASDTLRLVVREGAALTAIGAAAGLTLSFLVGKVLAGMLYEVSGSDPVVFLAAPAVLSAISLVACYVPARRAARVDPMIALRYE